MTVKNSLPGGAFRGLVQFDLSALPAGTAIAKATLRAWVNSVSREGTVDVLAVLDPWAEAAVTTGTAPTMAATLSGSFGVTKAIGGGSMVNFSGADYSLVEVTSVRRNNAVTSTVVPGAGTWNVGMCIVNLTNAALNNNHKVNGWVQVTN